MITMLSTMRVTRAIRWPIIGVLLLAAALLGGCSVLRVTYEQADHLLLWRLDGYVDFDERQTPRAREAIDGWLRWHRATQLPDYAALLARARRDVEHPATPEAMCSWFDEGRRRLRVAVEQALPAIADHVMTMTPAQFRHMEQRFAKGNDEVRADYLQADLAERQRIAAKRTAERFEMLYGTLDDAQREQVARAVVASPFDPQRWLDERIARQREVLATLPALVAEGATRDAVLAALRRLVAHVERSPRDAYRVYQQRLIDYNCAFAAQLHNATSAAQRQAAAARLKGWEDDLRALTMPAGS
jgi:uncharacterized coiled-coil protein SlyX